MFKRIRPIDPCQKIDTFSSMSICADRSSGAEKYIMNTIQNSLTEICCGDPPWCNNFGYVAINTKTA